MLKNEELYDVLNQVNSKMGNLAEEADLKKILSIIIMNPLDDDRKRCQEQIKYIINSKYR